MADEEIINDSSADTEQPLLDYAASVAGEQPEKKKKSFFGKRKKTQKKKFKAEIKVNAFVLFLCAALLVAVTVFATFFLADKFYYNGYAFNKGNKVTFKGENVDTMKVAKFQDVLDFICENYYTDYDINEFIEGAIEGVVNKLEDPYSKYYGPDTMSEYVSFIEGSYSGIGITVKSHEKGYSVEEVVAESPADKAGVKVGDILTSINGESVVGMATETFRGYLKTDGNTLDLAFILADGTTQVRKVTVSIIKEQSVKLKDLEGGLKYIRITQFIPGTADSFKIAVDKAVADKECKGIVLDLRGNPGGYADEAAKVADIILPEGTVATAQNRKGETVKTITSDANCIKVKLTVLINETTASASELVAGAIRDFKYGEIIGVKSYGKALGQINKEYTGDGSGIVLSSSRYFTPTGECIDQVGITPSIVVELAEEHRILDVENIPAGYDTQLYKAMETLGVTPTDSKDTNNSATAGESTDSTGSAETEGAASAG